VAAVPFSLTMSLSAQRASSDVLNEKISQLKREIAEIDDYFYVGSEQDDPVLYAGMLER
jgi:hypothetical protein